MFDHSTGHLRSRQWPRYAYLVAFGDGHVLDGSLTNQKHLSLCNQVELSYRHKTVKKKIDLIELVRDLGSSERLPYLAQMWIVGAFFVENERG